jgi:predicted deacetylase
MTKYLIRFDDICPTMNWGIWNEIEKVLHEMKIIPIMGIVPDNQDETLKIDQDNSHFWERVRMWQACGWTIGLHGYQHLYVTSDSGIIGLNNRSEFAGLPVEKQEKKLQSAIEIFRNEGVEPDVWIAPSHSFDAATITALKKIGIRFISDGHFIIPHVDYQGMMWIPHQLWHFHFMPFGVWTVGIHHNIWTLNDVERFRKDIKYYKNLIANFDEIVEAYKNRHPNFIDSYIARLLLTAIRVKSRSMLRGFH